MRRRVAGLGRAAAAAALIAGCAGVGPGFSGPDIPYVPTPDDVAIEMLKMAAVTEDDVVFDLGSGDGRLVIEAARRYGARGVGVEIDPVLVRDSTEKAMRAGVAGRVRFLWGNLFATDIGAATVVTIYLGDDVNLRLRPKLLRELRPGTRVVSHDFAMADWKPDAVQSVQSRERRHTLYAWVIPASVEGTWRFALPAPTGERPCVLRVRQRFQEVSAALTVDGQDVAVERAALQGDLLRLDAAREAAGIRESMSFEGRVRGDALEGSLLTVPSAAGATHGPWTARRT